MGEDGFAEENESLRSKLPPYGLLSSSFHMVLPRCVCYGETDGKGRLGERQTGRLGQRSGFQGGDWGNDVSPGCERNVLGIGEKKAGDLTDGVSAECVVSILGDSNRQEH